jgi:hypothetical protein
LAAGAFAVEPVAPADWIALLTWPTDPMDLV